jgi:5-formyltetrahydrofolate cyclo-ligase
LPSELHDLKARLRAEAKRRRASAAAAAPEAGAEASRRLLEAMNRGPIPLVDGAPVSAYWPKGDELDLRTAMTILAGRGHAVGLPVVVGAEAPLLFRAWQPDAEMVPAGFGLLEPGAGQAEVVPELLLVPLLAFDRRGMRLGYGGGFYDRTLAKLSAAGLKPLAVGLAYAEQEMAEVPGDATDRRLDWIVTEREVIEIREPGHAAAILR